MPPETPLNPAPHGPFRQILNNAGILLGGKALNAVLSLASVALTARALGVETFGVLVLIHAYVQTVGEIAKFQSWQALIQYGTAPLLERRMDDFHRVLRFSLFLDIVSGLAGIVIALAGIWLIGAGLGWSLADQPKVALYALSILFMVGATPIGVLRMSNRFDLLAAESTIESWVKLIGAVLVWAFGGGLAEFLLIWFVAKVVSFLFFFGACGFTLRSADALQGFRWRRHERLTTAMPGIWKFVWSTNFNSSLGLAYTQLGTLMVGSLLGVREAAFYRIAKQMADAVAKPAKLIGPALYPELAKLAMNPDRMALRQLVLRLGISAGGVATALLLIVSLAAGPALGYLIGPEYVAAKPVMLWLLTAAVIGIWVIPLEPLLISTGSASSLFWMRLAVTALYVPLLHAMISAQGLQGAGVAAVIGAALMLFGQLWLARRWFGRGPPALS